MNKNIEIINIPDPLIDHYIEVGKLIRKHIEDLCFYDEDISKDDEDLVKILKNSFYEIYIKEEEHPDNKKVYKYSFSVLS